MPVQINEFEKALSRLSKDWKPSENRSISGFAEDRTISHRDLRVPRPQEDFPMFDEIKAACGGTRWVDGNPPKMGEEPGCTRPNWVSAQQLYGSKAQFLIKAADKESEMDPDDINQGEVGDCWFLAGIALAAKFEKKVMGMVCTERDEELGIYEFTFRPEGRVVKVCVDDGVPIVTDARGQRVAYCHSRSEGELWPILLEKAYAKLYGGYQDISGGLQAHAISDLIGLDYFFLFLKFPDKLKHIDPRLLGPCVTTYSGAQTHMGCSWVEVFLHIRNPHGRGEWKGRYSDNWHGWAQEPALRQELITCAKDDGSFWMCMDDFAAHCQTLNCNPDQPVQDSGKPFKSQGRGPLPSPGSGPSPSPSPGPGPGPGPAGGGSTATCKKCGKAVALVTQLPPMYAQGLFGCDVCGRTHPAASGCYHCECGWDACRTCGGGGAPSPAPGPSPHPAPGPAPGGGGGRVGCGKCGRPLQVTTTLPAMYQQGVFSCDICKQLHFAANGVYHCDACQWDAGSVCAEIRG